MKVYSIELYSLKFDNGTRSYIHLNISKKGIAFELYGLMVGIDF